MVDKAKAASKGALTFEKEEILDETKYQRMRKFNLLSADASEVPVVPVRNESSPHFRRLTKPTYVTLVQKPEKDETHAACIKQLMTAFKGRTLRIATPIFGDWGSKLPTGSQSLLGPIPPGSYLWWDDTGGTRIPVGDGRYIQPDICGTPAKPSSFFPSSRSPRVVIEVIQTHPPEPETLYHLLGLSEQNHVVVLYFVAPKRRGTKFSQTDLKTAGEVTIRADHYLLGRRVLKKGRALGQTNSDPLAGTVPSDPLKYSQWYESIFTPFIADIMRTKDAQIPPKDSTDEAKEQS